MLRLTTPIKLRLSPSDAERLRVRASTSKRTLSECVLDMLNARSAKDDGLTEVRVRPSDAERLEIRAAAAGVSVSDFVGELVEGYAVSDEVLEAAMRLTAATYALSQNVKKMRADMGRVAGLTKNLFNEASRAAEPHHFALSEIVRELRGPDGAIGRADRAIVEVREFVTMCGPARATVRKLCR